MLNSKVKAVCKRHLKDNIRISLWFLAIYAVSITILYILMIVAADEDTGIISLAETFGVAVMIFIFVVGICTYSTFLKEFVYQGVTRKDMFVGTALSVGILSLGFAVLVLLADICVVLVFGSNPFIFTTSLATFVPILFSVFVCYMCGLMIGIVFTGYGVVKGIVSIAASVIIMNLMSNCYFNATSGSAPITLSHNLGLPGIYLNSALLLLGAVVLVVVNYYLNRNISVNISTGSD